MLLGVLEHIDIIGDALDIEALALHFVMQLQEVEGVPAGSPRLEVCKKVFWADLGV